MRPGIVLLIIIMVLVAIVLVQRGNRRSQERMNRIEERTNSVKSVAESARTKMPVSNNQKTGPVLSPGEHEFKIGSRKYLLYVPASYDASQLVPLVLFFHGGGGHMEQAVADYGWEEKADKEGLIVAFPNGSSRLPRQHLATWNAGNCCGYARDQNIDDISFVKQVVADIESRVNIDTARVFATGMSNGGMMAHRLACEMADIFTAVASVAGTDGTLTCTPSRPISVMHIHAKDDTHVLYGGGAGKDVFRDESKVADFTSVDETVRRWIERNHANPTPRRILDVPGAYADLYTSDRNNAQVELVVTETGGHSWPGGKAVRGKSPTRAVIANDIIWDFFKAQVRE